MRGALVHTNLYFLYPANCLARWALSLYHQFRTIFILSIVNKTIRQPELMRAFFGIIQSIINGTVGFCIRRQSVKACAAGPTAPVIWENPKIQDKAFSILALISAILRGSDPDAVSHKINHV